MGEKNENKRPMSFNFSNPGLSEHEVSVHNNVTALGLGRDSSDSSFMDDRRYPTIGPHVRREQTGSSGQALLLRILW